jgi:putative membrane protein
MQQSWVIRPACTAPLIGRVVGLGQGDLLAGALLIMISSSLWWLSTAHASAMPFWAPWDFSWIDFMSSWLVIWWFIRGLARTATARRPSSVRWIGFFAGMLAIYSVLQTHFEYAAQHAFVLNRIQHVVMHHLGPLLIALSWPGATIARGMPRGFRALLRHHLILRAVNFVQQPMLAALLFVGVIFLWLIPIVHFRAMLDARLFAIMNWSMVVDGILFWCLILDPRPSPPARASFAFRAAAAIGVMFPQILGGALIAFNQPRTLFQLRSMWSPVSWNGRLRGSDSRRPGHMDSAGDDERARLYACPERIATLQVDRSGVRLPSAAIEARSWTG